MLSTKKLEYFEGSDVNELLETFDGHKVIEVEQDKPVLVELPSYMGTLLFDLSFDQDFTYVNVYAKDKDRIAHLGGGMITNYEDPYQVDAVVAEV